MERKTLKILYIAHERKLGGATRSLLALIDEMQNKVDEILVIVPTKNCPIAQELRKRRITTIPVFFAWWQMPDYWPRYLKWMFRCLYAVENVQVFVVGLMLWNKDIDIVHTNSSVTDFGAKIARFLGCKHVWHVREYGDADYRLEYMKGKSKTWQFINNHADRIVFISKNIYQYFYDYLDVKKGEVVYNGISLEYACEREYQNKELLTFLVAGNLNRNKQQYLVLQAAVELLNRGITNFRVLIAGATTSLRDSKEYENELKVFIEKKLVNHAKLLGGVKDMKKLREIVDVEVVASSKEAFGRVTVEAMFSGIPIIASDSGANPELVKEGKNGTLFINGNYTSLADKMQFVIENQEYIQEWGMNAYKEAVEKFTASQNAKRIYEIYESLCQVSY